MQFLSTLSLRRATLSTDAMRAQILISIHALLAESDLPPADQHGCAGISIHALLAESDSHLHDVALEIIGFLSTLSLRRATVAAATGKGRTQISIHALLAESDRQLPYLDIRALNFYPRSPCGERPFTFPKRSADSAISIHALLAESDCLLPRPGRAGYISIHALLAESDANDHSRRRRPVRDFYPRSPCGERLVRSFNL